MSSVADWSTQSGRDPKYIQQQEAQSAHELLELVACNLKVE